MNAGMGARSGTGSLLVVASSSSLARGVGKLEFRLRVAMRSRSCTVLS